MEKRTRRTKAEVAKSKGLGDTIAKITEATGIAQLVHFVAGEDCNCINVKRNLMQCFLIVRINAYLSMSITG
jgi:hypothetical protein